LLYSPTNKDRLCEQSEPQSYPVVGQARLYGYNRGQSKLKFSLFISFACQEAGYFVTLE